MDFAMERAWQELAKAVKDDHRASECLDRLADQFADLTLYTLDEEGRTDEFEVGAADAIAKART